MDIMDELANSGNGIYKKTRFTMIENKFILNPNYTVYEKCVYIALSTYAFNKGSCYPSQALLSEQLNISRPMVTKALKGLEEKGGLLMVKRQMESNRRISNLIFLAEINTYTGEFIKESLDEFRIYKNRVLIVKGR